MISTDRRVSLVDSLERRFFFKRARSRFTTTANLVSTRFPRLDRVPSLVPWLYLGLLGFTEFYRVLPSFTEFYLVLLGFTEFYWVLLGFTGFYWVLLGFT